MARLQALTASFAGISLAAAFGLLSERPPINGIASAGVIGVVTGALGGTRVQASAPTGPMTAVTRELVIFSQTQLPFAPDQIEDALLQDKWINSVLILSGGITAFAGVAQLGRLISLVPNLVIMGFMNGIAVIIWNDQLLTMFGLSGSRQIGGELWANLLFAAATTLLTIGLPKLFARTLPLNVARKLPSMLFAIVLMTVVGIFACDDGNRCESTSLGGSFESIDDFTQLFTEQFPDQWSGESVLLALPWAFEIALLCYLDALLTSLVIDKMMGEKSAQNKAGLL